MKITSSISLAAFLWVGSLATNLAAGQGSENLASGATNSSEPITAELAAPMDAPASFGPTKAKAEKGDAAAQLVLGEIYMSIVATNSRGPEDTLQKYMAHAAWWFKQAALQGNIEAQYRLGLACFYGAGVPLDYAEALRWFRKAAEQGSADAQFVLGEIHRGEYNTPERTVAKEDTKEAVKWYRMAAERGNEVAWRRLAFVYERGTGSRQAIELYREAAKRGYVTTQFLITREEAETGDPQAEWKLGRIYGGGQANTDAGSGVPTDYDTSARWYRKAAEQGLLEAQIDLGMELMMSGGDPTNGIKWLRKAAQQGSAVAQTQLGVYYYRGEGVAKNGSEGAKWLRKAAEQGYSEGQSQLGLSYFRGEGVPMDYVQAYKWMALAEAQGFKRLDPPLSLLQRIMTPQQTAEGQRLASEFKPRKPLEVGKLDSASGIIDSSPSGIGTGFFITPDGYLVTSAHVVRDAAQVRLVAGARIISANVVQEEAATDLALLKAAGQFAALPVASSRSVALGSTVATVGFPDPGLQGFSPKLAKGEIAALAGAGDDARYFQISVPLQPGNSGGALVDEHANVVGIVSAKLDAAVALASSGALPENVNYAVKSSFLLSFLESVPDVSAKLKAPNSREQKFQDVVKAAQDAAVLVLVY